MRRFKMAHRKKEGHSSESATLMSRRQTHKSFMPPNIKKCLPDIK